jgi:hypothetical protein
MKPALCTRSVKECVIGESGELSAGEYLLLGGGGSSRLMLFGGGTGGFVFMGLMPLNRPRPLVASSNIRGFRAVAPW